MTTDTAIRASVTLPGLPEHVATARAFVGATLGASHPCGATAILLASELVTNSVLHSDSRLPGQMITITVTSTPDRARVEVRDAGGATAPQREAERDGLAEHGRGLQLVEDLSARWGSHPDQRGLITWFEVENDPLA